MTRNDHNPPGVTSDGGVHMCHAAKPVALPALGAAICLFCACLSHLPDWTTPVIEWIWRNVMALAADLHPFPGSGPYFGLCGGLRGHLGLRPAGAVVRPGADGTGRTCGRQAVPGAIRRPGSADVFRCTEHTRSPRRVSYRAADCFRAARPPARRYPSRTGPGTSQPAQKTRKTQVSRRRNARGSSGLGFRHRKATKPPRTGSMRQRKSSLAKT